MTLRQKQSLFVRFKADLILFAYNNGYELTDGEAWRPPEMAAIYAKRGTGIKDSLHIKKLAQDFNLFKNDIFLTGSSFHKPLGDFWESLHPQCRWGGRWKDGNHYEFTELPWR